VRRRLLLFAAVLVSASALAQDSGQALERIAFGSCNREYKAQPLWNAIREGKPDVWVWLGDIVYARAGDLADLARRYRAAKDHPGYKSLREQCRVLGTWDDHDYGQSEGGKQYSNKVESQRLLLDFLDEPPESSRRKQAGVFAAYTFGPPGRRVKIILLDCRYHRDKPGIGADILGSEQWQWLEQQLRARDADVYLIGSGIQVIASEHPYEKWADFPQARQRLLDLIAGSGARNVIFLSGDRHLGEISRLHDPRHPEPLYDITSSGMTHHAKNNFFHNFQRERNRFRCGQNCLDLNFGLVALNWEATPPTATLQIRDAHNAVRVEEKINLTQQAPPE
jgi:alkaline phosphatase D